MVILTKGLEAQPSAAAEAERGDGGIDTVTLGFVDRDTYQTILANMRTAYTKL